MKRPAEDEVSSTSSAEDSDTEEDVLGMERWFLAESERRSRRRPSRRQKHRSWCRQTQCKKMRWHAMPCDEAVTMTVFTSTARKHRRLDPYAVAATCFGRSRERVKKVFTHGRAAPGIRGAETGRLSPKGTGEGRGRDAAVLAARQLRQGDDVRECRVI
jgi:hypothetical protein